jgi:hypothetical protein
MIARVYVYRHPFISYFLEGIVGHKTEIEHAGLDLAFNVYLFECRIFGHVEHATGLSRK